LAQSHHLWGWEDEAAMTLDIDILELTLLCAR
jgi:hypothetical protein